MRRYKVKGSKGRIRKGRSWILWSFILFIALSVTSLATVVVIVESGLPKIPTFEEYAERVPKVSRVLAADGTVVAEFFTERRTIIKPNAIPKLLAEAVIAAEDASFFEHEGISYLGIFRALLVNLWRGRVTQGGSTITQQVVKQVLLSNERTVERKFRELLLARQVERKLSKEEILAIYMSEVYLGGGRYGFEEASRFYFGKTASELAIGEAALLAGLVSAPEANSPILNAAGAMARQRYVLSRMVECGFITEAEAKKAANEPIYLVAKAPRRIGAAPYFVFAVSREVSRMLGPQRLLHDGLVVETTLDLDVSDAAETAVATGLARLYATGRTREMDERDYGKDSDPDEGLPPPPKAVRAHIKRCDRSSGVIEVEAGGTYAELDMMSLSRKILAGEPDPFAVCHGRRELFVSFSSAPCDECPKKVNAELGPQVAIVVLNPHTREVLAIVGGDSFTSRPFDRAIQSRRPIGSTVKPFLYAAAMLAGISPDETFINAPVYLKGAGGRVWSPKNFEGGYDGKSYTMGEALARSINVVAVRVMERIGPGKVADLLDALGMPQAPRELSLALGSVEASPLVLANAMATFAANGIYDTPFMIKRIVDADGRVLLEHKSRPSRRIPQDIARRIRDYMREAVLHGTAREAAALPVWGKTGTTNGSREVWFVGSDDRVIVAVLVGYDDRLSMHGATGGNTAVPIFNLFMKNYNGRKYGDR